MRAATASAPAVLRYGDPRLRRACRPVRPGEPDLPALADRLWQGQLAGDGVGLSAPQVGDLRRVAVIPDTRRSHPARRLVLVNPVILSVSRRLATFREGCLSFPGLFFPLARPASVVVRYDDLAGRPRELAASGLLGRIVQHEVDHLDGVLFIDRLPAVKRWLRWPRLRRLARQGRREVR